MPSVKVVPVINTSVRHLCTKAYPGHPKGCPNWNHKAGCPPHIETVEQLLDFSKSIFAVYNRFDLGTHVQQLRKKHPKWSERQLHCCLYWQGTARKQLRQEVALLLADLHQFSTGYDPVVLYVPEANGVDVTTTMATVGFVIEWPPRLYAFQVALVGQRRGC